MDRSFLIAARARAGQVLLIAVLAILALLVSVLVPGQQASAAEAAVANAAVSPTVAQAATPVAAKPIAKAGVEGFDPGNIISDSVFFNKDTMSEAQIQTFLNSKVSACQSGYVCLKDAVDTSRNISADAMCQAYTGAGRESSARIIYKVAQACGINPQVIIVMLEKEQGLVRHTWPSDWRYTIAMGQGCPDTAACDTAYYGFFNQVYGAARQLKRYANPPGTSNFFNWYAPGNTWNILYNPNHSCGSSPVYVHNQATANLYYYTPYQPNPAALRAGYGEGDGCSAYGNRNFHNFFTDWFGSTSGGGSSAGVAKNDPVGFIDDVTVVPGGFRVRGWALDPNTSNSIDVHLYVGSNGYSTTAAGARPDLAPHYPGLGTAHGFDVMVPATSIGEVSLCAYGINQGLGDNRLLGCQTVESFGGSPVGAVESVVAGAGNVTVSGWALDPDTADAIDVHVYVGGSGKSAKADGSRTDIGEKYPLHGSNHGFDLTITAAQGAQNICVYGINVKTGNNVLLSSCQQVFVRAGADPGTAPVGRVDDVSVTGNTVKFRGWALDTDTVDSTYVHIYLGAIGTAHLADSSRWDIAAAYPGYGDAHGFEVELEIPDEPTRACAYAINDGVGSHRLLWCQWVEPERSKEPFGYFESVSVVEDGIQVSGWAIDPDTSEPIEVHVYVGSNGYPVTADQERWDVGAAYPNYGSAHGFSKVIPLNGDSRRVCAYAINDGDGNNPLLSCRTF